MEEQKRYCPFCGSKTTHSKCEICGKKTIPVSASQKQNDFDLMEDETSFDHITSDTAMPKFDHIKESAASSKSDHNQKEETDDHTHDMYGGDAYDRIRMRREDMMDAMNKIKLRASTYSSHKEHRRNFDAAAFDRRKMFIMIAGIITLFTSLIIISIMIFSNHSEDTTPPLTLSPETESPYLQYLKQVDNDNDSYALSCDIISEEGQDKLVITNTSDYYKYFTVFDDYDDVIEYFYYMEPHSTYTYENIDYEGCHIEDEISYTLDFHAPYDLMYQYNSLQNGTTFNGETVNIIMEEDVNDEQLKELMKYVYAGHVLNDKTYAYVVYIYDRMADMDHMLYRVQIDYDKHTLFFTDISGESPFDTITVEE